MSAAPLLQENSSAAATVREVRHRSGRRRRAVLAALAAGVVVLFFAGVLLGSYTVTIPDFVRILAGERIPGASFIVMESKLPRAVTAVLIGAAFGISGHLFQTMLRNPLASPDIIGISYGASAAAVTAMVAFGAAGAAVSLAALAGACVIAVSLHLLSRRGGASGARLVLMGIGFAAVLQAVVNFLLTRTDVRTAAESLVWLTGSLNSASWERAGIVAAALVVLLPAAVLLGRRLRVLELGDDFAAGLGLPVEGTRAGLLFTGVALAAVATAAAGPVAFVAFLAGPISRRLIGGRASLAAAGLTGALILLAADFVASNLLPGALPVGVVTGALGAPFLLWLLVSSNRVGRGG